MPDWVVVDGDTAQFESSFGAAAVIVIPGNITGRGSKQKVSGKAVCIEGDESSVEVPGCSYSTPTYLTPGTGTLSIDSLASDQKAQKLTVNGEKAILVGSKFNAKFTVMSPAVDPSSGNPDTPSAEYSGFGSFVTNNTLLKSD